MASLYPKKIAGKTYWYLREMARVDGRPKMVSERYRFHPVRRVHIPKKNRCVVRESRCPLPASWPQKTMIIGNSG